MIESLSPFALLAPAFIYGFILVLHAFLPARRITGYVVDPLTRQPQVYRLNGLLVLIVVLGCYLLAASAGWTDPAWFYHERWSLLLGACVLGLGYTLVLVLPAPATGRGLLNDLFFGRIENREVFDCIENREVFDCIENREVFDGLDTKMYLYLAGAVMLVLNSLSFAVAHHQLFGAQANPGVYVHAGLLVLFVMDYLWFEQVHLYTYDLFAERLGFKLTWGCLVFYPFFYPVGLWGTTDLPTPATNASFGGYWLVTSISLFLLGWAIARGANMQKYTFKRHPDRVFLGFLQPEVIGNGSQKLLCSGYWGASRHINYLGEILMAVGIAASLGHIDSIWPWLYPLYYVLLLVPRERDDDRRCAAKYGGLWTEYKRQVPYRIIPGIY
jgi:protein-S-isoprenylcysteine O-methyltransferase Ste14